MFQNHLSTVHSLETKLEQKVQMGLKNKTNAVYIPGLIMHFIGACD